MSLTCSLTGLIPFEPVFVRPSGYMFEKRELVKKLKSNGGTCPITGTQLNVSVNEYNILVHAKSGEPILLNHDDGGGNGGGKSKSYDGGKSNSSDIFAVQTVNYQEHLSRTIPGSNIPGTLNLMQQTYNEMMKTIFTQKRDINTANQQLRYLLHHSDAASRTIKRLLMERDNAKKNLEIVEAELLQKKKEGIGMVVGIATTGSTTTTITGAAHMAGENVGGSQNRGGGQSLSDNVEKDGGVQEDGGQKIGPLPTTLVVLGGRKPSSKEHGVSEDMKSKISSYDVEFGKRRKEGSERSKMISLLTPFHMNRKLQKMFSFANRHQSSAPGVRCGALLDGGAGGFTGGAVGIGEHDSLVITGGEDGILEVFDVYGEIRRNHQMSQGGTISQEGGAQSITRLRAHEGAISCIGVVNSSRIVSGSEDTTFRMWEKGAKGGNLPLGSSPLWSNSFTSYTHDSKITDLAVHPIRDLVCTADTNSIAFTDISTGQLLKRVKENFIEEKNIISQFKLHPSGKAGIVAQGKKLQLWDILNQKCTENIFKQVGNNNDDNNDDAHDDIITSISMSSNAVNFVSASKDGVVQLWDLRKKNQVIQKLQLLGPSTSNEVYNTKVTSRFDESGQYLFMSTDSNVFLYNFESKTKLAELTRVTAAHSKTITDLLIGKNAGFFLSMGMDRCVNVYQSPETLATEPSLKRQKI